LRGVSRLPWEWAHHSSHSSHVTAWVVSPACESGLMDHRGSRRARNLLSRRARNLLSLSSHHRGSSSSRRSSQSASKSPPSRSTPAHVYPPALSTLHHLTNLCRHKATKPQIYLHGPPRAAQLCPALDCHCPTLPRITNLCRDTQSHKKRRS